MCEHPIGLIVYRLGRHPFTVQRGVRFPLGLLQNGLIDTQSVTRQVRGEKGVSDPDSSSWGRSSVWLEHSTVTREVAGSSPVGPVLFWEISCCSIDRAAPLVKGFALVVKLVDTPS